MMRIEVLRADAVKIDVDENATERQALIEAISAIAGMISFFATQDKKLARVFVDSAINFLKDDEAIRLCAGAGIKESGDLQ